MQRDDGFAKVWLNPVELQLQSSGDFSRPELRRVLWSVERNQARFPEEWNGYFDSLAVPGAMTVAATEDTLTVELTDGRTISVPLAWYPRLLHATPEERDNWELFADAQHIHWPDLDEDISVEGLLAGRPSQEGAGSFKRWLEAKHAGRPLTLDALRRDHDGQ